MKKTFLPATAGILLSLLLLSGMWLYFRKSTEGIDLREGGAQEKYERHYVMIGVEGASNLWREIYESAAARAQESGVYLELLESDATMDYSLEDFLRISIAAQVDGIIMQPDGSSQVRKLIDEAWSNGIPVVTVLEDDSDSLRISFVGTNSYQMGVAYAEEILENLKEDKTDVMVLTGTGRQDTSMNLTLLQLTNDVREKSGSQKEVNISRYLVNTSGDFEMEEAIRDIFVNQDELPDILVCLNEMITEAVYQAIVDFNQVGNVDVIGYYQSDSILDAIRKCTITSTVSFSTSEMGRYSVDALNEFYSLGHVSSYFNVTLKTIDATNVVSAQLGR